MSPRSAPARPRPRPRRLSRSVVLVLAVLVTAASALVVLPGAASAAVASWTAKWVWTESSGQNQWVVARKTFSLASAPSAATLSIAADTKYWLYVNGELVVFEGGLKRGPNPTDSYYDEVPVTSRLRAGSNTVALLVWHFGKDGFSHKNSGKGGLLAQLDATVGGEQVRVASDSSWKLRAHPGFRDDSSDPRPNYRLAESNVSFDARDAGPVEGWQTANLDDSGWPSAVEQGSAGTAPWGALVPRPIPLFTFSGLRDYTNADSTPGYGQGATAISMRLPSNIHITPYLRVDAPAGATIGIRTDHYTDGGENTLRATYVTKEGEQEFESPAWLSGTAVEYTIPSNVRIISLKYRESGYATSFAGSFQSSNPRLNTLWTKAQRSTYLNMRDTYMDCPTRERAPWIGDAVNNIKQAFYAFDTDVNKLGKKALTEFAAWQKSDGSLYSPTPSGNWGAELPVQSLAGVTGIWDYYRYTGDSSVVGTTYEAVSRYLKLWSMGSDGLVTHRPGGWDWLDWGGDIDAPVLENAWYYWSLQSAIDMATLIGGETEDIALWEQRRASIRDNYDRVLWQADPGRYRSPGHTGATDDRGNAMAVIAGLAGSAKYAALTTVLTTEKHASPYMEFYVLEALYRMGRAQQALARMTDRYSTMIDHPGYTLFEFWTTGGSGTDDHGWAGGPLYALSAYAVGVRPTAPGYTTYVVQPQLGGLTSASTRTPTVRGNVDVSISTTASSLTLALTSPSATTARVSVPANGLADRSISVGGTTVFSGGASTGAAAGVTYVSSTADAVVFDVAPGSYTFTQNGTSTGGTGNLAAGRAVTSSSSLEGGDWGRAKLTDGVTTGTGFTTDPVAASADVSANPAYVQVDLGSNQNVGSVTLHPRTGVTTATGTTANYPVDFRVETSTDGSSFTPRLTVTSEPNPQGSPRTYSFDAVSARHVRITVTRLGTPASDEGIANSYRLQLAELEVYAPADPGTVTPITSVQGYTQCASEGGTCSFSGSRQVAYGAGSSYLQRTASDGVACTNQAFGSDPLYGVVKACYLAP